MSESQELFEPSQINENELIDELLNAENETQTQTKESSVEESQPANKREPPKHTGFPLSRIKTLMRMDPDVGLISSESIFLIAKATELFLKNLSKETYTYTVKSKRKTVQKRDVDAAIENVDALCFLEGAMDN